MLRSAFVAAALWLAAPLHGLTVRPPTFDELVRAAEIIVRAEVVSTRSELRPIDGQPIPFTLVTLRVEDVLKGTAARELTLHCLGGIVGNQTLRVVGAPELLEGDRGFFFIQRNGTQFIPFVAVTHGVYWSVWDPARGDEVVLRADGEPLRSAAQVSAPLHRARVGALSAGTGALTAAEFARTVRNEVSHARR